MGNVALLLVALFGLVGRLFVKRFALCYGTLVCLYVLSVCDVGVLWPNGWMDRDETWHAGRPRPWPHFIGWGPSSPSPKGHSLPPISAHICFGQMAGWIKMPLDMEVGFGCVKKLKYKWRIMAARPTYYFVRIIFLCFWGPFVKRFALCYETVVCLFLLSVSGVGLLWPNGWMDQDETWHRGRPPQ